MLTKRELEIITLRKKGLNQKQIAKKLKISQPAVSKFENNIKRKIEDTFETVKIIKKLGMKIGT